MIQHSQLLQTSKQTLADVAATGTVWESHFHLFPSASVNIAERAPGELS